ncbi:MAG TPA: hypothetical protein VIV40_29645 [Kofleriaceae bacterium]
MRWLGLGPLLCCACRIGFDPLGVGGVGDIDASGDGIVTTEFRDASPLPAFNPPIQQTALSSARDDQGPSLTADLLEIYFYSGRNCGNCYDVFVAKRATATSAWGTPTEVTELTNAAWDMAPEISPDGLTLWWASERSSGAGVSDIWVTTRPDRTSAWATPMRETNLSTPGYDLDPALSDDGLTMTLTSDGPSSGTIASDLYISTRATLTSPWSTPVPISELNTSVHESAGSLRSGGHLLYMGRETTAGKFDIHVAARQSATTPFSPPVLLDNVNGPQLDFDAWLSADEHTMFFASDRTGNMEIYEATR